jgi:hypothetical protein
LIRDYYTGSQRRSAGSQPLLNWNIVVDVQRNGMQHIAYIPRDSKRRLPDEVIFASGDAIGIAAGSANRQLVRWLERACQIKSERETECIEAGAQVRTGCGDA